MTTHHPGVGDGVCAYSRGGETLIYEADNPEAWIRSDYVVEVG